MNDLQTLPTSDLLSLADLMLTADHGPLADVTTELVRRYQSTIAIVDEMAEEIDRAEAGR